MKIVSFNINSIRARPHQLIHLRDTIDPDVIGIQETKVNDPEFPIEDIKEIEISESSGSSLTVLRENPQSNWMIDKPLRTNTNSKSINEWISKIVNLSSQKFIDKSESITASYFNSIFKLDFA